MRRLPTPWSTIPPCDDDRPYEGTSCAPGPFAPSTECGAPAEPVVVPDGRFAQRPFLSSRLSVRARHRRVWSGMSSCMPRSCLPNFRLKSQKITASGVSGTYGADLTHLSLLYAQSLVPNGLAAHYGAWPLLLDEFPKGSRMFQSVAGSTASWVAPYPGPCLVCRMVRSRILLT